MQSSTLTGLSLLKKHTQVSDQFHLKATQLSTRVFLDFFESKITIRSYFVGGDWVRAYLIVFMSGFCTLFC